MRRMGNTIQIWSWRKPIALATTIFFLVFTITPTWTSAETINLEGGTVDVTVQDNTTNWNVSGNPVWSVPEFNIAEGSTYNIAGLGSGSSLALLVNGGQASNIFGTMNLSNLAFILQNIYGINIGATGIVNLNNAALIASTLPLNLNATDFLKQNYQFSGQGGFLTNDGKIIGNNADLVALVANAIENKGTIEVPMGTVALAAGDMVSIGISPDGLISIGVDEATANTLGLSSQIKNTGLITADGGRVVLDAKAIDGLFDRAISLERNASAVSAIRADNGAVEFVSIDDIYNESLIRATDGQITIDSVQGDVVNAGTMEAVRGSIDIATTGAVETKGILRADEVTERGASFKMGGRIEVGHMDMDNLDHRADITEGAELSGIFSDEDDITVLGNFSLIGDTMIWTDSDGLNDDGTLTWAASHLLTGNSYNLTLKVSKDSTVGAITGVNLLTLDKNAEKTPTYTGSTSDDISVNTIRTELGTIFTKDVTDGEGNHLIYSASNAVGGLQYMGNDLAGDYKLANNVDASETVDWNGGLGFDPIGDYSATFFSGVFEGDSKAIANLTINRPSENYVGLFGYTNGAMIRSVSLLGGSVIGGNAVGGLVGRNDYSTLSNIYNTGNVTGAYSIGGLSGCNTDYSTLSNSYSTGIVTGANSVGGLVGYNNSFSSVSNSYSTSAVIGGSIVGGLVGWNNTSSSISNSYSTGSVSGTSPVGGLVGWNYSSSISNSYSTGSVSGTSFVGGLIGNHGSGTLTNNYWDTNTSGQLNSSGEGAGAVEGKTTIEMMQQATFSGWTFGDGSGGWVAFEGVHYPHLDWEWSQNITTLLQLQNMNLDLSTDYTLMNDIDASSTAYWNWDDGSSSYLGFDPVGNYVSEEDQDPFTGIFDGDSHIISGLTINRPTEDYVGLFAATDGATLQNVGLVGGQVVGGQGVGSLASVAQNFSVITNVYNTGSVSGETAVGGLLGGLVDSSLTNSYNTGSVEGLGDDSATVIGGLAGMIGNNASIVNSYNTGSVSGQYWIGGLVGVMGADGADTSSITNSYNAGDVNSIAYEGGIVAELTGGTLTNTWWHNNLDSGVGNSGDPEVVGQYQKTTSANDFYNPAHAVYDPYNTGGNQWGFGGGSSATWVSVVDNDSGTASYPILAWQSEATPYIMEGAGVEEDPYLITNIGQLQIMAYDLGAHYQLANDINAAIEGYNTNSGFYPVGKNPARFEGTFNGASYAISDLTIYRPLQDYVGLFGYTNGATVQNIGLVDANITGDGHVGSLVGLSDNLSIVSNSYSTGSVTGNDTVGGLVGANYDSSSVTESYAACSVVGGSTIGGLVGLNRDSSSVTNSYATGSVTGENTVGGLVGFNFVFSSVTNSYATGNVEGIWTVGGLVGYHYYHSSITNSYATGNATGGNNVGGLVGYNVQFAPITNSYALGLATSTGDTAGGLIGNYENGILTNNWWFNGTNTYAIGNTSDVGNKATSITAFFNPAHQVYQNSAVLPDPSNAWDFTTVWRIYSGYTNPLLKSFLTALTVTANDATNTYNGTTTVAGNGVTYSVEPSAELLGTVTFTSPSKNVGTYAGGLTASGLYSTQQGYDITFVAGDLTITQATVTLSGITAENKVYDGTTDATVNTAGAIFTGMFAEDVLTVDSTGTFVDKEIGTDKTVNLVNTFGGADLGNYDITDQTTTTASILRGPTPPAPPAPPTPPAPPIDIIDPTLVTLPGVGGNEGTSPITGGGTVLNPPPSGGNTDTGTGTGTGDTMGGVDLGMVFGSDSDTGLDLGTVMNIGDDGSVDAGNLIPETIVEPTTDPGTEVASETTVDQTGGTEVVTEDTASEAASDQENDAGTQETEVQQASSESELPDLSGTTRILELLEDYFSVQGSALLQTDVRVEEGAVYVVPSDGKTEMSLLEQGEFLRVFYKEQKTRDLRPQTTAEVKAGTVISNLKSVVPSIQPAVSSAEPEAAPAAEQRVMKPATPVVMEQTKGGSRYGVLKNPSRNVFVKSHGGEWQAASDGMVILPGDEVKTASSASVNVSLEGGKVGLVEIKEGSLFRINKAETDLKTGDKMTLLDLAIGKVLIHAGKLQGASKFEVRTPTALTGVRGTVFEVTVKEKA